MMGMETNRQSGGRRVRSGKPGGMAVFDLAEIQIWKARRGVLALENAARRLREDWKFSCGRVVDDLVKTGASWHRFHRLGHRR